ncbi:hypothetical protein R6Q57_016023 [Mikania cordata]
MIVSSITTFRNLLFEYSVSYTRLRVPAFRDLGFVYLCSSTSEITSELEQDKTKLSKTKIRDGKYDYSSIVVARLVDFKIRGREPTGLGYSDVKPPFNHNYSIMPKINKSVDDQLLKSDQKFEFTTDSSKQVSLTIDPILTDLNRSDNSEVCAEDLSISGRSEEEEERSAGRSTNCSVSSSKSHFVPRFKYFRSK